MPRFAADSPDAHVVKTSRNCNSSCTGRTFRGEIMKMDVVETATGVTRVILEGRLDIAGAQEIDQPFSVLGGSRRKVVVDLAKVSFLASLGLRTLMFSAKAVNMKGGKFVVCAPDENVEKVLRMSGIADVIPIFADYAAAEVAVSS